MMRNRWLAAAVAAGCLAWSAVGALADGETAPAEPTREKPFRLMSDEDDTRLRTFFPELTDGRIQEVLDDPRLILYTEKEMPKAYQDWSGQLQGIHSPSYNISANGSEPFGNGNREFPWSAPAGTHRAENVRSFRFLWLPRDEDGNTLPVVWFRDRLSDSVQKGYAWRFPVGTIFGEVLTLRSPDGKDYTFELRVRIREYGAWAVDVFRPFPKAEDLAERIKELRPDYQEHETVARLVSHLEEPVELTSHKLVDPHPFNRTFVQSMGVDSLPGLDDPELITELLTTTPFRSALGETWRRGTNGVFTCAPTTKAGFHIVPAKYDAGFVEIDQISCLRCHETVNQSVRRFEPARDWYGRIRGSDGIFSFHPFDPSSISYNGYSSGAQINRQMTTAGVLAKFDPSKHPAEIYHRVRQLKE